MLSFVCTRIRRATYCCPHEPHRHSPPLPVKAGWRGRGPLWMRGEIQQPTIGRSNRPACALRPEGPLQIGFQTGSVSILTTSSSDQRRRPPIRERITGGIIPRKGAPFGVASFFMTGGISERRDSPVFIAVPACGQTQVFGRPEAVRFGSDRREDEPLHPTDPHRTSCEARCTHSRICAAPSKAISHRWRPVRSGRRRHWGWRHRSRGCQAPQRWWRRPVSP
jgi:hypothetical protein